MQLLSKAIYEILSADVDVTDIVGSGNIWHAKLPQRTEAGSDKPVDLSLYFYTYAIQPNDTKSGQSEVDAHMLRVCIVGNDDADMYELGKYVRYALDRIPNGVYNGIWIDGSKFLNASFDPEGNYELEVQEWVLEFQVRVIDNDIREEGGTNMAQVIFRQKITMTYADFADASTSNTISSTFTLAAKGLIHTIFVNPTTDFSGGGLTTYTLAVGTAGDTSLWMPPMSIFTGASHGAWFSDPPIAASMTETTDVKLTATASGDLDLATAGSVDIYIDYSILT